MKKQWFEYQKDFWEAATAAYKWIDEHMKSDDVDENHIEDLELALEWLGRALRNGNIAFFMSRKTRLFEGENENGACTLSSYAYEFIDLKGADRTWAIVCANMRNHDFANIVQYLARKGIVNRGTLIDINIIAKELPKIENSFIQYALNELQKHHMHDIDGLSYATVIDGFGAMGTSLFDAASLASHALDHYVYLTSDRNVEFEEPEILTNLNQQLYCVNRTIGKDPSVIGKNLYEKGIRIKLDQLQYQNMRREKEKIQKSEY